MGTSIIIFDWTSKHLLRLEPKSKSMTRIHEFNEEIMKKFSFSAVCIGNHIYILLRSSLYRFEYGDVTPAWEKKNALDDRHGPSPPAVFHSGKIYVVGSGGGHLSKSLSKYDPSLNRWQKMKDKKLKTRFSAIAASKGFIYNIGGEIGVFGESDRVERMNVVSQTWDEIAPMNIKRCRASAVECNEKVIVAGGGDVFGVPLNSVEKYDPDMNQWTIMKPMMEGRWRFRLHSIEGNLFAVNRNGYARTIEKYDSSNDRWEIIDLGSEMWIEESVSVNN